MGAIIIGMPMRLFGRLNEIFHAKHLEQAQHVVNGQYIEATLLIVKFPSSGTVS